MNEMTAEEAVNILDDMKVKIDVPKQAVMQNKKNQALDMAIQALEAQPTDAKQDCEHCIHTYGTLGCCDMVNNEWVYDCDFGKEQYKKEHEAQQTDADSSEFDDVINKTVKEWFDKRTQPCEDCVSRQAVLDTIGNVPDHNDGMVFEALSHAQRDVALLPSVTPERPKGKWIISETKEEGYDIGGYKTWYIQIKCSNCRFIKTAIEGHTGQYKFCPSCGARMSGGAE